MNELINIKEHEGKSVVSSREVANNFEKKHKHVLESIENLKEGQPKNRQTYLQKVNINIHKINNGIKNIYLLEMDLVYQ